jgi:hypothetical protein
MLVLARKINEGLTVTTPNGETIQFRILDSRKSKIRSASSRRLNARYAEMNYYQRKMPEN